MDGEKEQSKIETQGALYVKEGSTHILYEENGKILSERYRNAGGELFEVLKAGCDHHPHGLDDLTPLLAFAERHYG